MRCQKGWGLLLFLVAILLLPMASASTYEEAEIEYEFENMRVVVKSPVDGEPVSPNQLIQMEIYIWIAGESSYGKVLVLRHNGVTEDVYMQEDKYVKQLHIESGNGSSDTVSFVINNGSIDHVLDTYNFPVSLPPGEPAHPHDQDYEDELDDMEDEHLEELEAAKTITILKRDLYIKIMLYLLVAIVGSIIVWMLPRITKTKAMRLENELAVEHMSVYGGIAIAIVVYLLYIGLKMGGSVQAENFVDEMLGFLLFITMMIGFGAQYTLSYYKFTPTPETELAWFLDADDNGIYINGFPWKRYHNNAGESCVAVPSKYARGQFGYRMKGKDILFEVRDGFELENFKPIYYMGRKVVPLSDINWTMEMGDPNEPVDMDAIRDMTEEQLAEYKENREKMKAAGGGLGRHMCIVDPGAVYTRGHPVFLALFNHCADDEHRIETAKLYRLINDMTTQIKFMEMYGTSEEIHSLISETSAFETAKSVPIFQMANNQILSYMQEATNRTKIHQEERRIPEPEEVE